MGACCAALCRRADITVEPRGTDRVFQQELSRLSGCTPYSNYQVVVGRNCRPRLRKLHRSRRSISNAPWLTGMQWVDLLEIVAETLATRVTYLS